MNPTITKVEEHRIETALERTCVRNFLKVAAFAGPFTLEPTTLDENPCLGLWLKTGENRVALALFCDELGNWTILEKHVGQPNAIPTVRQFFADEVV